MENECAQTTEETSIITISDDERDMLLQDKSAAQTRNIFSYVKHCWPILIFPLLYFPYTGWWRLAFANLAISLAHQINSPVLRLMITGNNTILLFWCIVTLLVMLLAVITAIAHIRPWYAIPVYIAVMFSLCGICSIFFYTSILR